MKIDEYKKLSRGACNKYGAKRVGKHASKKEHYRSATLQMMQPVHTSQTLFTQIAIQDKQ